MLENAVCPFKMYGHDASQVSTNKRDLAIFWWDRQYFCLIIKQKAGWLVGTSLFTGTTFVEIACLQVYGFSRIFTEIALHIREKYGRQECSRRRGKYYDKRAGIGKYG